MATRRTRKTDAPKPEAANAEATETKTAEELAAEIRKKKAATLKAYKATYKPCTTHRGTKSLNNGDAVASLLAGVEPGLVASLADVVMNEEPGYHAARYAKLNPGAVRMNSGNRIRGAVKNGTASLDWVKAEAAKLGIGATEDSAAA